MDRVWSEAAEPGRPGPRLASRHGDSELCERQRANLSQHRVLTAGATDGPWVIGSTGYRRLARLTPTAAAREPGWPTVLPVTAAGAT